MSENLDPKELKARCLKCGALFYTTNREKLNELIGLPSGCEHEIIIYEHEETLAEFERDFLAMGKDEKIN